MQYKDNIKKLISPFVHEQIPFYVPLAHGDPSITGGSLFTRFVQLYYEWLERSYVNTLESYSERSISSYGDKRLISVHDDTRPEVGNVYDRLKRLSSFNDIDNTIEPLLKYFNSEFIPDFPYNIVSDRRKLIKLIKEIYTLKGTETGFKVLFNAIYGKKVYMVYPREHKLFQSSGSVYKQSDVIRVSKLGDSTTDSDFSKTIGYYLVGEETGVKVSVISSISKRIGTLDVVELGVDTSTLVSNGSNVKLSSIERVRFETSVPTNPEAPDGNKLKNTAGIPIRATINPSITGVTITKTGNSYGLYDDNQFRLTGTNHDVGLDVKSLTSGEVEKINMDYRGQSVYGNDNVSELVGLSKYFKIYADDSWDGSEYRGFRVGDTLSTQRGSNEATADIKVREGNKLWVDNISGTFKTDDSERKEYGAEIIKTGSNTINPNVEIHSVSGGTNWGESDGHWDLSPASQTSSSGNGVSVWLSVSDGQAELRSFVNLGSGYAVNDTLTFSDPESGAGNTDLVVTILDILLYRARIDEIVEVGDVDITAKLDITSGEIDRVSLISSGSNYTSLPRIHAPIVGNAVPSDHAILTPYGEGIGGIGALKISKYGIVDSTTAIEFKDRNHKTIVIDASQLTSGDFEVGHTIYQGSSLETADATGVVTYVTLSASENCEIGITDTFGDWVASANVENDNSEIEDFNGLSAQYVQNIISLSGEKATGTINSEAIVGIKPKYTNRSGHLNAESRVKDSHEYQEWSYIVRTAINPDEWLGVSKNLLHPAGMNLISDFTLDRELNSNIPTVNTVIDYADSLTITSVTGSFSFGDAVYQGNVGSETLTANVISWDTQTNVLVVDKLTGDFTYALISIDNSNYGTITHINGVAD